MENKEKFIITNKNNIFNKRGIILEYCYKDIKNFVYLKELK